MSEARSIQVGKPHRPFGVKLINLIGRVAKALGLPLVTLGEDRLLRKAIKQAGSSDFGDENFREGLRRFLASAESEAELTLRGRLMVQGYTTADFGIDRERDRAPLQEYIDYFGPAEAGKSLTKTLVVFEAALECKQHRREPEKPWKVSTS